MDSLSHLLALLAPRCEVNLHCRFGGRWQAGHQQMRSGVVPWHVVLRGEGRLNVGGQTHHLRAGDVVLLPYGSPHLMESLVEWGQVLPVAHRFNGTVTEMRVGPAEGALEMLCGEFYFGPHVSWLFSEASTLIHLHTDAREDCPELDALLNILVRESLAQRPGGSAIVRSLGDTLLVLLLRMLLGEQQPPGGLLRLMSDERLMPAVLPVAHRFNGTVTEMRVGPAEGALEMLCGEFYFGPHVSWLFSEASTLIHLHTDAREDCPELDALLNILVRESLAQRPGGSAIVRSLGDTLLVLLLRMLLGEQQPPGGLLRLMSDERLMPAVLAVMATPEQPWTLETMAARAFLSRATFARHFARVYHLTPQAWLSQLRMALAARLLRLERQTNLEVIAERCGFQSLASFSKRFKMRYGVTPGEWRRG